MAPRHGTFFKMSGSGNDFVMVDGRDAGLAPWTPEAVRAVCARRTGVGADGVAVLEPGSGPDRVRLHYFNADGTRAELCGNASLCAARMAAVLDLAPAGGLWLETDAGEVAARCLPGEPPRSELALPTVDAIRRIEDVPLVSGERAIYFAVVGVPHAVVLVDDVEAPSADPSTRGRALRSHAAFGAAGANVNFVSHGPRGRRIRTWERGVEAETLACGTGAVASAAAVCLEEGIEPPVELVTSSGLAVCVGGTLSRGPAGGRLSAPTLSGEGRIVFIGRFANDHLP